MGTDGGRARGRDGSCELGELAAQWAGVGARGEFHLHPDTAPDVIRARHRALVRVARRMWPRATAAEIGKAVCLPTWLVEQRWKELDATP